MTTRWTLPTAISYKYVVDCTDEELTEAGFLGQGAYDETIQIIKDVRKYPKQMSEYSVVSLAFMKRRLDREAHPPPKPPTPPPRTNIIEHVDSNDLAIVSPHLLSKFERENYYHGISRDPPELYYRSDHESNPYPLPSPGAKPFRIPIKTLHGVFETPLNAVWDKVARLIIGLLKERGIHFSSLLAMRYSTCYELEGGSETMGPVVIWIGTRSNTTSPAVARDISTEILRILEEYNINDVPVEWYECEDTSERW